jgi:hypothetical protein
LGVLIKIPEQTEFKGSAERRRGLKGVKQTQHLVDIGQAF